MYPNLKAELVRKGWTIVDLAKKIGVPASTLYSKLSGKTPLAYKECLKIKETLGVDIPLEVLFAERVA